MYGEKILKFNLKSNGEFVPSQTFAFGDIYKLFKIALKSKLKEFIWGTAYNIKIWAIKGENNDYSIYIEK